jgi:hypothetical protein
MRTDYFSGPLAQPEPRLRRGDLGNMNALMMSSASSPIPVALRVLVLGHFRDYDFARDASKDGGSDDAPTEGRLPPLRRGVRR